MVRSRLPLFALSACLLGTSASRADDMGYIDCTNHPEDTPVAAKAAKTQETVGSLPCGERFTILQSGFFFTRIQTPDGKVGYVYTNLISHDYSATAAPAPQAAMAPAKMAARSGNPISAIAAAFKPKPSAPAQMRVPAPPAAATPAPTPKPNVTATNATAMPASGSPAVAPVKSMPPAQTPSVSSQSAATQDAAASSLFPARSGVIVLNDTVPPAETPVKSTQATAEKTTVVNVGEKFPAKSAVVVQSETTPPARVQSKPVPVAAAKATVAAAENFPAKSAVVVQSETTPPSQVQSKPVQAASAKPAAAIATENFPAKSAVVVQSEADRAAQPQPPASHTSVSMATPIVSSPEPSMAAANPEPSMPPRPSAEPAQPAASDFRAENPGAIQSSRRAGRRQFPLIELFGGYSFARVNSGAGVMTNYNGGMGAFGLNVTSWLQFTGDSSYNMIQGNGTKVVLYGNHYGPRLFWHRRNRWGVKPFVEGLFGGTRLDTTVTGTGGYTTSNRVFSFKVGGGLDIHPSRHFEIRLVDADYYRTAFAGGPRPYQNNYWISTGVVVRLFGSGAE
jgi:hypothetical protein